MEWVLLGLVGIAGVAAGAWFGRQSATSPEVREKEAGKQRILEHLRTHGEITNDDVEELLGVSDITAWRYAEELEQEGHIRQHGDTGRGVYYTLI